MLGSKAGDWVVEVTGENSEESPYVAMTEKLIKGFLREGGTFQIEPDASSGSYFIGAAQLLPPYKFMEWSDHFGTNVETTEFNTLQVARWPTSGWQIDQEFKGILKLCESANHVLKAKGDQWTLEEQRLHIEERFKRDSVISRKHHLGDSIMTAIVVAPFLNESIHFTDLGRLRVQESERVVVLRTELTKCGAKVIEEGDTLTVFPSEMHAAEIETYDDHRMAMCFAVVGLKVPGIKIRNPACVKKTFPNFFQKLAGAPPHGLGTMILDARSGRALGRDELFAD